MKLRHQLAICAATVLIPTAMWSYFIHRYHSSVAAITSRTALAQFRPSTKVRECSARPRNNPQPTQTFTAVMIDTPTLLLPSGPSVLIFDAAGNRVDYSSDIDEDGGEFRSRWVLFKSSSP